MTTEPQVATPPVATSKNEPVPASPASRVAGGSNGKGGGGSIGKKHRNKKTVAGKACFHKIVSQDPKKQGQDKVDPLTASRKQVANLRYGINHFKRRSEADQCKIKVLMEGKASIILKARNDRDTADRAEAKMSRMAMEIQRAAASEKMAVKHGKIQERRIRELELEVSVLKDANDSVQIDLAAANAALGDTKTHMDELESWKTMVTAVEGSG